ncbi:MAG: CAP domain-containing protein [Candidatus Staskawiczbacteria bacterium]|nr:CAP domain-containing protein [Candidatus Staskawiczbacteria bacterium]
MDYSVQEDIIERIFEKIKRLILPSEDNNYKSRFLQSNLLLYCVVLLLTLKIVVTLISINLPQNIFFADITKLVLQNSVNQTRQSSGLKPLIENQKLNQAAQLKAQNMVANNYFAHTSPTGVSPWFWFLKVGYNYKYAGENLAIGILIIQKSEQLF